MNDPVYREMHRDPAGNLIVTDVDFYGDSESRPATKVEVIGERVRGFFKSGLDTVRELVFSDEQAE